MGLSSGIYFGDKTEATKRMLTMMKALKMVPANSESLMTPAAMLGALKVTMTTLRVLKMVAANSESLKTLAARLRDFETVATTLKVSKTVAANSGSERGRETSKAVPMTLRVLKTEAAMLVTLKAMKMTLRVTKVSAELRGFFLLQPRHDLGTFSAMKILLRNRQIGSHSNSLQNSLE